MGIGRVRDTMEECRCNLYHELCEVRTDCDRWEDANRNNDLSFVGWRNSPARWRSVGDLPILRIPGLNRVFPGEIELAHCGWIWNVTCSVSNIPVTFTDPEGPDRSAGPRRAPDSRLRRMANYIEENNPRIRSSFSAGQRLSHRSFFALFAKVASVSRYETAIAARQGYREFLIRGS